MPSISRILALGLLFPASVFAQDANSGDANSGDAIAVQSELPAELPTPVMLFDYPFLPPPTSAPVATSNPIIPQADLTSNPLAEFDPDGQPVLYNVPVLDENPPPVVTDSAGTYVGMCC